MACESEIEYSWYYDIDNAEGTCIETIHAKRLEQRIGQIKYSLVGKTFCCQTGADSDD